MNDPVAKIKRDLASVTHPEGDKPFVNENLEVCGQIQICYSKEALADLCALHGKEGVAPFRAFIHEMLDKELDRIIEVK